MILVFQTLRESMGTQCIRCAPGKFKSPEMLFTPCTLCPENTFSALSGATQCTPCPPYSSSVMGSSRCTFAPCRGEDYNMGCVCPVGKTGPDGGPCSPCAAGTYKNVTGDARCTNCGSTKTSVAGSASCFCRANYTTTATGDCLPCMNGMISYENSAACFCPNGTSLVDGRCAKIYSEGLRLSGFISIGAPNSSNASAPESVIQQLRRSIAAQYNISESLVQIILSAADESRYQVDVIIMATSREDLARVVNQTSTAPPPMIEDVKRTTLPISLNEGAIVLCAENETSIGTVCVCAAGYTRRGATCVGCAPGTSKASGGDGACDSCSNNTFSRTAAAQCSPCPFSAVMKDNHTSCSCNTAFVFFNGTCTATESVYLNVTGVLKMPEGDFAELELQKILMDGLSSYLNFSQEFITIIISRRNNDNGTDTNLANATTNMNGSSPSRRRLLFDLSVEYIFTALFQIQKNDQVTYARVQNFTYEAQEQIKTITEANGYLIVMNEVDLTPGYFTAVGAALRRCDDGKYPEPDAITKKLECKAKVIEEVIKEVAQATAVYWLTMAVGVLVLGVCICIHYYRKSKDTLPTCYETVASDINLKLYCTQQFGVTTKKLQVPATVAIEYRLLPGQSI